MDEMSSIFVELIKKAESEIYDLSLKKKEKFTDFMEIDKSFDIRTIELMKKEIELYNTLIIELEELLKDDDNKEKSEYEKYLKKAKIEINELESKINGFKFGNKEKQKFTYDNELIEKIKEESDWSNLKLEKLENI